MAHVRLSQRARKVLNNPQLRKKLQKAIEENREALEMGEVITVEGNLKIKRVLPFFKTS